MFSDVTLMIAAASCTLPSLERLGQVDAPRSVIPVLQLVTRVDSASPDWKYHDPVLNTLFMVLNMSSVPDNQVFDLAVTPICCNSRFTRAAFVDSR